MLILTGQLQLVPPSNNQNFAGIRPIDNTKVLRYLIDRLYGTFDSAKNFTQTGLWVDGGATPGQAVQLRLSYDWTNDGTWDRVELFNLFACDPLADNWESYAFQLPNRFQTISGTGYQNFNNGSVMMELWQALGPGIPQMTLKTNAAIESQISTISLPYKDMYQAGPNAPCNLQCNGPVSSFLRVFIEFSSLQPSMFVEPAEDPALSDVTHNVTQPKLTMNVELAEDLEGKSMSTSTY